MRRVWVGAVVAMLISGCASSPGPVPASSASDAQSAGQAFHINPANIRRIGGELPPGYEHRGVTGTSTPAGIWGPGTGWTADPPQCAVLADPIGAGNGPQQGVQGVSASGAGGIVYAVVAASPAHPVALDPALVAKCSHWVMTYGRATVNVRLVDPPHVDGVETLGMTSNTRTFVEGGTEIDSLAHTFTTYLGDYYAFTVLVTDPGSPHPPLQPQFAADLLAKTVSALRD